MFPALFPYKPILDQFKSIKTGPSALSLTDLGQNWSCEGSFWGVMVWLKEGMESWREKCEAAAIKGLMHPKSTQG